MIHELDPGSNNPRMQCEVCGKWMRLIGTVWDNYVGEVRKNQIFYGGCYYSGGDHLAGNYVCDTCCHLKCCELSGKSRYPDLKPQPGGPLAPWKASESHPGFLRKAHAKASKLKRRGVR